jgi:hypothetical protein
MEKKMTKVEMFKAIKAVVADNADFVAFIDHEIELLNKKSANKKPTQKQAENEGFKAEILATLTDKGVTISELQAKSEILGPLSNQKVSALLRQMVDAGTVAKTVDKKKSYFSLPTVA